MRFQAKTEKEIQEEKLIPEGDYDFTVVRAEEAVSKKGNPMLKITLGVYMSNGTQRLVNDYLMEAVAYKLRHFCDSVGVLKDYEAGCVNAPDLEGRSGKVRLIIKEQKDFPDKNEVKDYLIDATPTEAKQPASSDDDMPDL